MGASSGQGGRKGAEGTAEKAEWVKPGLVAHVKFLRGEDKLRHATVQSLREGKLNDPQFREE